MDHFDIQAENHSRTADALEVALKGLGMRSKALTGNIANVNTPGYKRRNVDFEETLMKTISGNRSLSDIAMEKTHQNHFSNEIAEISHIKGSLSIDIEGDGQGIDESSFHNDGNNVDIDREMIELTKTGLRYKAVSKMTKKHFEGLRGIIRGG